MAKKKKLYIIFLLCVATASVRSCSCLLALFCCNKKSTKQERRVSEKDSLLLSDQIVSVRSFEPSSLRPVYVNKNSYEVITQDEIDKAEGLKKQVKQYTIQDLQQYPKNSVEYCHIWQCLYLAGHTDI